MSSQIDVAATALRVVNQSPLGLFVTVDGQGQPHARWMAGAAIRGIGAIYTLTGKNTRKIEELRQHPRVCWVFTAPHHGDVVTLHGTASAIASPMVLQSVWDRLAEAARAYAMSATSDDDNLELITIETKVQRIELLSPRHNVFKPMLLDLTPG